MFRKFLGPKKEDICPNCGTACYATDVVCPSCGKNLDELFEQLPDVQIPRRNRVTFPVEMRLRVIALLGPIMIAAIVMVGIGGVHLEDWLFIALLIGAFPLGWYWFFHVDFGVLSLTWIVYGGLAAAVLSSSDKRLARALYVVLVLLVLANSYGCVRLAQTSGPLPP